jgi:predicted protein tyrosine phosphatase
MIKIANILEAPKFYKSSDLFISILDPGTRFSKLGDNHFITRFIDSYGPTPGELSKMKVGVKSILTWVKNHNPTLDTNILVHCHAGISRSSAIAWLLYIQMGVDPEEAFKMLYSNHPSIWPNRWVLIIGAEHLKLDSKDLKLFKKINDILTEKMKAYEIGDICFEEGI